MDASQTLPLQQEWRLPSPKLRVMRQAEMAALTAIIAIIAVLITIFNASLWTTIAVFVAVLVLGAIVLLFVQRRIRAWGYCEREDDLLIRRGVFITRLSVVPYGRMQFVDVKAGPIERLFKLATLQLHTAAAATDAKIPGLNVDEAGRLREQLAALGESRAAGL